MNHNQSQKELDKAISLFVLKTSLSLFMLAKEFLENNENLNYNEFCNALKNRRQSFLNSFTATLELQDLPVKNIAKSEVIHTLKNQIFKNIFIEYKPDDFHHFCKDDAACNLLRLEFQYLYCQYHITINYGIESRVVVSFNFDDNSLKHFIDYYFRALEKDFLKDLAINDFKETIPQKDYTTQEYNTMQDSCVWQMNVASMSYINTDNIKITNAKLDAIKSRLA